MNPPSEPHIKGHRYSPEFKAKVVGAFLSGTPAQEVAKNMGVELTRVYAWSKGLRKSRYRRPSRPRRPDSVSKSAPSRPAVPGLRELIKAEIKAAVREMVREEWHGLR